MLWAPNCLTYRQLESEGWLNTPMWHVKDKHAGLTNCGVSQESILGPLLFLIYVNDLPQALNETWSHLYADDTCIFYQDKDVEKIEKVLKKEFSSLCEWFIGNKLSIHFGDDKTKTIFFSQMKSPQKLNISYRDYSLTQHNTAEHLGCYLDSNLSGESLARRLLKKINTKLNFLWRLSNYLNYLSRRLLCNALIYNLTLTMDAHHGILSWVTP